MGLQLSKKMPPILEGIIPGKCISPLQDNVTSPWGHLSKCIQLPRNSLPRLSNFIYVKVQALHEYSGLELGDYTLLCCRLGSNINNLSITLPLTVKQATVTSFPCHYCNISPVEALRTTRWYIIEAICKCLHLRLSMKNYCLQSPNLSHCIPILHFTRC